MLPQTRTYFTYFNKKNWRRKEEKMLKSGPFAFKKRRKKTKGSIRRLRILKFLGEGEGKFLFFLSTNRKDVKGRFHSSLIWCCGENNSSFFLRRGLKNFWIFFFFFDGKRMGGGGVMRLKPQFGATKEPALFYFENKIFKQKII